ncbi:GIY-YIG nuclease family protein [bacterium]|nr:GIY-YIG nuclease family protein [bacterium]
MNGQYYVYILTNKNRTTLYAGVTNDIHRRLYEHKNGVGSKFVKKYGLHELVYFEVYDSAYAAIAAEKKIKAGNRARKIELIVKQNPGWKDLGGSI